jgi:hypothetical protein
MQVSRVARPGVIVAAGWIACIVYAFPGVMTADSFAYLRQARSPFFEPANPPGMAALWRWLEVLIAGPSGVLIVQTTCLAIGAYALLARVLSPLWAAIVTAVLLVVPPVLVPMAAIWSHSLATGLLALGAAGLLSERPRLHRASLVPLLFATCVYPAALIATAPLVLAWLRWQPGASVGRRLAVAALAWLAISGAALGATKHWAKRPVSALAYVVPRERPTVFVPSRALPEGALKLGVPTRSTAIQDDWTEGHAALADVVPVFSPWPYLALLVVLAPFALRQPDVWPLLVSAFALHGLGVFTAWLPVCLALAGAIVLARRRAT